jgi:hypothetical protein
MTHDIAVIFEIDSPTRESAKFLTENMLKDKGIVREGLMKRGEAPYTFKTIT